MILEPTQAPLEEVSRDTRCTEILRLNREDLGRFNLKLVHTIFILRILCWVTTYHSQREFLSPQRRMAKGMGADDFFLDEVMLSNIKSGLHSLSRLEQFILAELNMMMGRSRSLSIRIEAQHKESCSWGYCIHSATTSIHTQET